MKKILFLLLCLPMLASAQTTVDTCAAVPQQQMLRIGYFSYDEALKSSAAYAQAQQQLEALKVQYENEAKRVEEDFNKKYEAFLEDMKNLTPNISQKRRAELEEYMEKNIAFKAESKRLLDQAEKDAMAPLHTRMKAVLAAIGKQYGYAVILNTDSNACPFIDPQISENITDLVKENLK